MAAAAPHTQPRWRVLDYPAMVQKLHRTERVWTKITQNLNPAAFDFQRPDMKLTARLDHWIDNNPIGRERRIIRPSGNPKRSNFKGLGLWGSLRQSEVLTLWSSQRSSGWPLVGPPNQLSAAFGLRHGSKVGFLQHAFTAILRRHHTAAKRLPAVSYDM